jgi:hypothetical protein
MMCPIKTRLLALWRVRLELHQLKVSVEFRAQRFLKAVHIAGQIGYLKIS